MLVIGLIFGFVGDRMGSMLFSNHAASAETQHFDPIPKAPQEVKRAPHHQAHKVAKAAPARKHVKQAKAKIAKKKHKKSVKVAAK